MARRGGKKGEWLFTDDWTGFTSYSSKAKLDYWGNLVAGKPLQRNLQEISSPLNDPQPVAFYRGPQYEATTGCDFETQPLFIGKTTIPTKPSQATYIMGLDVGIGDAEVGCTFVVR